MQKWNKVGLGAQESAILLALGAHMKPDVVVFRKILEVFESSDRLCPSLEQLEAAGLQNDRVLVFHWLLLAQHGFIRGTADPAMLGVQWKPGFDDGTLIEFPPVYWTGKGDSFLKGVLRNPSMLEQFGRLLAEHGMTTGVALVQQLIADQVTGAAHKLSESVSALL
jgi:hypothetical protein